VQASDGYYGWAEHAPYDAMIIKEAIDHVPSPLLAQLKRGGRMVLPLGPAGGPQYLTLIIKDADGKVREERIMPVRFSPLQGGERT
jgi:protein-L-isoaspartate(D-aspartate) O-methyltransferase